MTVTGDTAKEWLDAGYPRPQLCRSWWKDLCGPWRFREDPTDLGLTQEWYRPDGAEDRFCNTIQVPYPPGSKLSGIGADNPDTLSDVIWYQRTIDHTQFHGCDQDKHLLLNFEAIDYHATIWVNGQHVTTHHGGYSPITIDLGLPDEQARYNIVVRAADIRNDLSQPRGKQAWQDQPEGIWYHRSNGIWRDVWLESAPACRVEHLNWTTNLAESKVHGQVILNSRPESALRLDVSFSRHGKPVAQTHIIATEQCVDLDISIPQLHNRINWETWLWTPQNPQLIDVEITVTTEESTDRIISYLGLRTVGVSNRYLLLNEAPIYIRGILDQGYWPESYYTAPDADALKKDIALIKNFGFNLARVHERSADRRYLSWADYYGVMVWAESASTWTFNPLAVQRVTDEWLQLVIRDRAHPSVITWVPFNESWGVSQIESSPAQQAFVEGVVALTRALDPSRPVSANDGWEQLETDIVTTHDYGTSGVELFVNYMDADSVAETVNGIGPQGRRTLLTKPWRDDRPVIVSEFGGISSRKEGVSGWGYDVVSTDEELAERIAELVGSLLKSPILAGFCYTQLTDTEQETNGLCRADRTPKIPTRLLRGIITAAGDQNQQIRPRIITERAMGRNPDEV